MFGRAVAWSLGVHALALAGIAILLAMPATVLELRPPPPAMVSVDAPELVEVAVAHDAEPPPPPPPLGRDVETARSSGHGEGAPPLLSDRADESMLRAQAYDAASGYQMQRIDSARTRESREQVRATPHPAPTPWLASRAGSGHGRHTQRLAAHVSDERVAAVDGDHALQQQAADARPGFARPDVRRDPAATDAARPSDDVADRVDQPLVSDEKQPKPIELSRPTSTGTATSGRGDGALGFSPTASGAAAVPVGSAWQHAYDDYLMRVRRKVDPLWEFPRELAIRMEQGDVLVAFTINKDGSVKDVRVLKGSGFDSFDKVVLRAIKKAAPFDPLPATLGAELHVTAPFEGSNPAIR